MNIASVSAARGSIGLSVRLRASRDCRRAAAYGRERFRNGTKGRRRRRFEASDNLPATLVAGSFRNGDFSSIETGSCRPTNWIEKTNQEVSNEIDRAYWTREKRKWPVDLMGGDRQRSERPTLTIDPKLRQAILQTECVLKDDELTSHALRGDQTEIPQGRLPHSSDLFGSQAVDRGGASGLGANSAMHHQRTRQAE